MNRDRTRPAAQCIRLLQPTLPAILSVTDTSGTRLGSTEQASLG
jgi:hypothetical protein